MRQYVDMIKHILENGERRENRTGVDTIGVFGYQMRFDLQKGFPLLTTKKMAWKSTIAELLWFLRGDTNIEYLKDNGCKFWDEWCDKNGDARKIYGAQWRRWETLSEEVGLVPVKPAEPCLPAVPINKLYLPIRGDSPEDDDLIGKRFTNSDGLEYVVLRKSGMAGKNSTYDVQFAISGSIVSVSRPNLRGNQVRDPLHLSVCGVGYLDVPDVKNDRIYELWYNMIARCYNPKHPSFKRYGAEGVTVSSRWHSYKTFSKEIAEVPFYWHWVENPGKFELDKDYFGARQYSKSTSIFLSRSYNNELAKGVKPFKFKDKIYVSIKDFCRDWGFDSRRVSEHLSGTRTYSYLESIESVSVPEGFIYRKLRVIDQISRSHLINVSS